jgi:hypothetical protein
MPKKYNNGHVFTTEAGEIILMQRLDNHSPARGIFKCYCKKKFESYIHSVSSGDTKSCGCYKKKLLSYVGKMNKFRVKYKPNQTIKNNFGTIKFLSRNKDNNDLGTFKCFCGKKFEGNISSVFTMRKQSCGCIRGSGSVK